MVERFVGRHVAVPRRHLVEMLNAQIAAVEEVPEPRDFEFRAVSSRDSCSLTICRQERIGALRSKVLWSCLSWISRIASSVT